MKNILKKLAVAALFTVLAHPGTAKAELLPNPVGNAFLYGDFYSYSLPILAYKYALENGGGVGPGNPFYITSTPGAISDGIVVATGASGTGVNTNFAGMDDAYPTPNGKHGLPTFQMGVTVADPGPLAASAGGQTTTWDTQLSALSTFLNGSNPVIYFNNNQINSGDASNQLLYVWMQVAIRDLQDPTRTKYFDLKSMHPEYPAYATEHSGIPVASTLVNPSLYTSPGAASINPPEFEDFVISGGQVCTNATGTALVDCNSSGAVLFNHNLGANQAAYAVVSPEINNILKTAGFDGYDVMSIDLRMSALNNGFEQLFILPEGFTPPAVPEPGTLVLLGAGLIGLGVYRRQRSKK